MQSRRWDLYLNDMIEAIERIIRYTRDLIDSEFRSDQKTIDAVIRNVIVLGEAVKKVPDSIIHEHPEVPWHKMQGLRNLIVHEYFSIDLSMLWETIRNDLPPLLPHLRQIESDHRV